MKLNEQKVNFGLVNLTSWKNVYVIISILRVLMLLFQGYYCFDMNQGVCVCVFFFFFLMGAFDSQWTISSVAVSSLEIFIQSSCFEDNIRDHQEEKNKLLQINVKNYWL